MPPLDRPIFVTGMGRSGTTLLRALLAAHSNITIPPETHFLKNASNFGGLEGGRPDSFDAFWAFYARTVNFRNLGLDPEACRRVIEAEGDTSYRGIFAAILSAFLEQSEAVRIGEKTPNHVDHLHRLLGWFPAARVLILRRDPRAVVASQLRSPWVTERLRPVGIRGGFFLDKRATELCGWAREWNRIYRTVVPEWQDDPRVMVVSYESLVQEVEGTLRSVCEFIEEEYESEMIGSRSSQTVPVAEVAAKNATWHHWREKHRSAYMGPVDARNIDKWQQTLGPLETAGVEARCGRGMREAGYPAVRSSALHAVAKGVYGAVRAGAAAERAGRAGVRRVIRAGRPVAPAGG